MNKLRKFLNASVMVMTVIAMSGFAALAPMNTAKAAASAGDLIKMAGNTSVYYFDGSKRFVFPNESTYFSWYSDFSGVVTIEASELQSYPLGGNVTMRAGTKLVKITTDPSVYAVEPNGVLRKIQSEAQAAALYGTDWAKRVVDVPDAFFVNYTIGSALASGSIPAGSLVKTADSASVYYFDGTNYRSIASEAAMTANRFSFANIITVSSVTAGGTAISGMEAALVKTSQGATTGPVSTGSGLMVSLNSSTPASMSVPENGTRVSFAKYNFTASNDGNVVLDSITVKRTGLSEYSIFSGTGKIWMEKDGVRVTSQKSMSSNDEVILTFSPALVVNAGQTITLEAVASLNSASGNAALTIVSASAVSAGGASVSGSFPISGNLMSFTNYPVAQVKFKADDSQKNLKVGDTQADFGSFELSFATTSRDVVFKSITLRNTGVEDLSKSTSNLYLEKNGQAISGNAVIDGRFATFTLNGNGMLLERNDSVTVKIKGDVMAKENTGTSTIFNLRNNEDLSIVESSTGFGVEIVTVDDTFGDVVIAAGSISVTKKSTQPASSEAIKGAKGITSLVANVFADEAIVADGLKIVYTGASSTSFENAKVYVNGLLLGSFDPNNNDGATETIDTTVNFKKGDNEIKVTTDVRTAAVAGAHITFSIYNDGANANANSLLNNMAPEYVASGNTVTDINGSPAGAKITVQGAELTVARNDGLADGNKIVKGAKDVLLARFNVKAVYDTVKITSVTLDANNYSVEGNRIPDSSVYDMKLVVNGSSVTKNFSSGSNFSGLSISIAKDTLVSFEVWGSFDTNNENKYFETNVNFYGEDSRGKTLSNIANNTVYHQIVGEGSLTIALGADSKTSSILLAKSGVEHEVAQYRLTAIDDLANVTEITATTTASIDDRIQEYRLYDGATLLATDNPMNGVVTFRITDSKLKINANSNKTLTLKAVLNPITTSNQSNKALQATLTGYKFNSSAGNETATTTLHVAGETMEIRKTAPTFALVSGVTGGQGSLQNVFSFSVTADANEDVILNSIKLTESGSASGTEAVSHYYLYEGETERAATSTSLVLTPASGITIAKGTSKTFTVKANTSNIPADANFGIMLEKGTSGANISWSEYFVAGNLSGTGANLSGFPLVGSTMKY